MRRLGDMTASRVISLMAFIAIIAISVVVSAYQTITTLKCGETGGTNDIPI